MSSSFKRGDIFLDPKTKDLAFAIAYEGEGLGDGKLGHVQTTANNPGDLLIGDKGLGLYEGKTIFATLEDGWQALYDQCNLYRMDISRKVKRSATFYQLATVYTGNENS